MANWTKAAVHGLLGTNLELHQSGAIADLWVVVEWQRPATALSDALPLREAKRVAEAIAAKRAARPAKGTVGK
jgi:hypothetical protein